MEYLSVRDLRASKDVWDKLSQTGELVLTTNGNPTALVIDVNASNLEETIATYRQAKAMRLINNMRIQAGKAGKSRIRMEEIEEEIAAVRKEASNG